MNDEQKSKRASIAALLRHPSKKIHEARTIFCTIYRRMLIEEEISLDRFQLLTSIWRKRIQKFRKMTNADVSSDVSNLHKELDRPTMTPETFIKTCQFLGAQSVEFIVRVGWPKKKDVGQTLSVQFHNADMDALEKIEKALAKEGIKMSSFEFQPPDTKSYSMPITDIDDYLEHSRQQKIQSKKSKKGNDDGKPVNSDGARDK